MQESLRLRAGTTYLEQASAAAAAGNQATEATAAMCRKLRGEAHTAVPMLTQVLDTWRGARAMNAPALMSKFRTDLLALNKICVGPEHKTATMRDPGFRSPRSPFSPTMAKCWDERGRWFNPRLL